MTINIENVWLLLIFFILIIAVCAVVGIFAWWQKSDRQIETLEDINRNITKTSSERDQLIREGQLRCEKTASIQEQLNEQIKENLQEQQKQEQQKEDAAVQAALDLNLESEPEEDIEEIEDMEIEPLIDIAAMVRQAAMEEKAKKEEPKSNHRTSVGKSGKVYTLEELEQLIDN